MRELASAVYWAVVGGLLSFGFLGAMTIGGPFLLVGWVMAVLGFFAVYISPSWIKGVWAVTLGLGGMPLYLLLPNMLGAIGSSGTVCSQGASGTVTAKSAGEKVIETCSYPAFSGGHIVAIVFFGAITLAGPAVRLFLYVRGRRS